MKVITNIFLIAVTFSFFSMSSAMNVSDDTDSFKVPVPDLEIEKTTDYILSVVPDDTPLFVAPKADIPSAQEYCALCKLYFHCQNPRDFLEHINKHFNNEVYRCIEPSCNQIFIDLRSCAVHMRTHLIPVKSSDPIGDPKKDNGYITKLMRQYARSAESPKGSPMLKRKTSDQIENEGKKNFFPQNKPEDLHV